MELSMDDSLTLSAWVYWLDGEHGGLGFDRYWAKQAAQILARYGRPHALDFDGLLVEEAESAARELLRY